MAKRSTWIVAVVLLVLVGGCIQRRGGRVDPRSTSAVQGAVEMAELAPMMRPPVPDLPVPAGFKLDEGGSRSFSAAGTRYVDHVYRGRADKYEVARFYRRHMPLCRWTMVTDMFVQGKIMLDFEKEGERCRIIIDAAGTFSSGRIQAQIWAQGGIPARATR